MNNLNLISNFAEFKELKNIDKATMIGVLEDVFRHALQKQYGTDENFDIIINDDKGDLEIWRNREVVADEDFEDEVSQIKLSDDLRRRGRQWPLRHPVRIRPPSWPPWPCWHIHEP